MEKKEINFIAEQLRDTYQGGPWYGKSFTELTNEIPESVVYLKKDNQHSILELLWHMITWREFTVDRLQHSPQMQIAYFEKNDWRELDHNDKTLWKQGLERIKETQDQLLTLLEDRDDSLLEQGVRERSYNFRKLLYGTVQHDIYHLGQMVVIWKENVR
jgi:uncharacterized damage-inducible protein DinB